MAKVRDGQKGKDRAELGAGRGRVTRDDLEEMRKEFSAGLYHGRDQDLDDDLRQVRRALRLGINLRRWALARGVPISYALALQHYLEQE